MSRELFLRLFQLMPNDDLYQIVKKSKLTPPGFTLKSLTQEKVESNRNLFVNALLRKVNEVNSSIGRAISNEEQYKEIESYRRMNKSDLLQLVKNGANPFWLVIALVSNPESYEMGSLVFFTLDTNGDLEKYSVEAEKFAIDKKTVQQAKQKQQHEANDKKQEDKKSEALERKITKLEDKVISQEETIVEQNRRIKMATAEIAELESRLKKAETSVEELRQVNAELTKRLEAKDSQLKQQATNHNSAINAYRTKSINLEESNVSFQQQVNNLTKSLQEAELQIKNLMNATDVKAGTAQMDYLVSETLSGVELTIRESQQERQTEESQKKDQDLPPKIAVVGANTKLNDLAVKSALFPVYFCTAFDVLELESAEQISEFWVLNMDVPQDIVRDIKLRYQDKFVLLSDLIELKDRIKIRNGLERRRA